MIPFVGVLCLCLTSCVLYASDSGILVIEDMEWEWEKDLVILYEPRLATLNDTTCADTLTRGWGRKDDVITSRAQGCLTQASRPVVCLFVKGTRAQ